MLAAVLPLAVGQPVRGAPDDHDARDVLAQGAGPIELQPTHIIEMEDGSGYWDAVETEPIAFSPDGRTLYLYRSSVRCINVWAALVYQWPEVLGGVTAVSAFIALLVFFRVLRRPREQDLLYCRRCNYCLENCESERCPECGVLLARRRPVRGRGFIRRTAPMLSVFLLVGAFYASLWIAGFKRESEAQSWFTWWSDALGAYVDEHGPRPSCYGGWPERIIAFDTQTGRERVVRTCTNIMLRPWPLVAPDGKSLFVPVIGYGIQQIDLRSGRALGELRPTRESNYGLYWPTLAGVSPDGRSLYATLEDGGLKSTFVIEWDLKTRRAREIAAFPGEWWANDAPLAELQLVPGREGPLFLDVARLYEGMAAIWDVRAQDQPVANLPLGSRELVWWELSLDRRLLYTLSGQQSGVQVFDIDSTKYIGTFAEHTDAISVYAGGAYLLLAEETPTDDVPLLVISAQDGRELATLVTPPGLQNDCYGHLLSPDGSWAAIICYAGEESGYAAKLVLYNLEPLDGALQ